MEKQTTPNRPFGKGSEAQRKARASLLLPNTNQATKVPSLGHPFLTNLKHPPGAFSTNFRYPPAAFPSNLNFPATFPGLPGQMQPLGDYNSQPIWDGNSIPNFEPFLPMPQLAGQIAIPPAGSGFAFHQAGATVDPVGLDSFTQFPSAPFDASGSNPINVSSSSTTATSNFWSQRFIFAVPLPQGRTLLPLLEPSIFASLLLLLPVVPCIAGVVIWSPVYPVVAG